MYKKYRCPECGEDEDISYPYWEGRALCSRCWAREVSNYAEQFPFMLAQEMGLEILSVPSG